jgi:hypothetical protein
MLIRMIAIIQPEKSKSKLPITDVAADVKRRVVPIWPATLRKP